VSWLARWWEIFLEYNIKFVHIEGQKNIITNVLSWNLLERVEVKQKSDTLHESMLSDTLIPTMHVKTARVQGKLHFNYDDNKEFSKTFDFL
jgi:hypothetical protein